MDLFTARGLLDVPVGASAAELREQYRMKARSIHPDAFAGASEDLLAGATEAMADLNCAYDTLRAGLSEFDTPARTPYTAPAQSSFWEGVSEVAPTPTFGAYASFARPAKAQWGRKAVFLAVLALLATSAMVVANKYNPAAVTSPPVSEGITPIVAGVVNPAAGLSGTNSTNVQGGVAGQGGGAATSAGGAPAPVYSPPSNSPAQTYVAPGTDAGTGNTAGQGNPNTGTDTGGQTYVAPPPVSTGGQTYTVPTQPSPDLAAGPMAQQQAQAKVNYQDQQRRIAAQQEARRRAEQNDAAARREQNKPPPAQGAPQPPMHVGTP